LLFHNHIFQAQQEDLMFLQMDDKWYIHYLLDLNSHHKSHDMLEEVEPIHNNQLCMMLMVQNHNLDIHHIWS
jgi:hypothetical protein